MRPVRLDMEGFGAFREATTVDFADADLFALQGPTGSGKSTVIDAICFALYGNVPRYDDQRLVGAAMSSHAMETKVRLRFELGGRTYDVVRVVRRTSGANSKVSTREARLEEVDGAVLAGREGELRGAVEELLGLTFDDFTRCVVLPQGAFARFLHDRPADRQALLVRLLDLGIYGRMLQRSNTRAGELERQGAFVDGRLASLPDASPERIAELAVAVAELVPVEAALAATMPELVSLAAALADIDAQVAAIEASLTALARIEMPAGVAELAEHLGGARLRQSAAEAEHAAAGASLDRAAAALAAAPDRAVLQATLDRWERHAKGTAVIAELRHQADAADRAVVDFEHRAEQAEATAASARAAAEQARTEHLAHALAGELRPGEDCPVCRQRVTTVPSISAPPALDAARRRADRAADEAKRAGGAVDGARREAAGLAGRLHRAVELLEELSADLAGTDPPVTLSARLADVAALAGAADAARGDEQVARRRAVEARAALDALVAEGERHRSRFHAQRDGVVGLGPPAPAGTLAETWQELSDWARPQAAVLAKQRGDLLERRQGRVEEMSASRRSLSERLEHVGIETAGAPVESWPRLVERERDRRERRHVDAVDAVGLRAELVAEREQLGIERSVAVELARQLKADRFQRWLVTETLVTLADRASLRLAAMTGDRFSLDLAASGEFSVIDHHEGDERRPVRTLSGGETFQASLALALALSDHLVELSGRRGHSLESIFLDEGFGTLDAESLDAVATAIESLHHDGRMVGIVTHVAALAERMPVRFVVSRGARTAIVERVTA